MDEEQYGTSVDYIRAFEAIRNEGISDHHDRLLRAHLGAPGYAITWEKLAKSVGYQNGSSVNLHYGKFAKRVVRHLGLSEIPQDPNGKEWSLWALVRWGEGRDPESGHTVFVLRRPAVEALRQLGIAQDPCFEK